MYQTSGCVNLLPTACLYFRARKLTPCPSRVYLLGCPSSLTPPPIHYSPPGGLLQS